MLKAHLDAVEQHLLHVSRIPANAGHTLHRGTPREAFIKEFLTNHLSAKLAVGTGEIIDASSLPREPRNQFDIVIYKAEYPKLHLGGEVNAFLAESVVATIEVKSLLTDKDLDSAIGNASRAKKTDEKSDHFVHVRLCAAWNIKLRYCLRRTKKYVHSIRVAEKLRK